MADACKDIAAGGFDFAISVAKNIEAGNSFPLRGVAAVSFGSDNVLFAI